MHDTERSSPRPVALPASEVVSSAGQSKGFDPGTRIPPEAVGLLIGLIDELERLFGDPPRAWAALEAEVDERRARWESRQPAVVPEPAFQLGGAEQGPEGAESSAPGPSHGERRPFLGFDREVATYERHKPELLEMAEGKWVVVVVDEVVGAFDDIVQAERAGLKRFGAGPLYIKQVLAQDLQAVGLPTYAVVPCRT